MASLRRLEIPQGSLDEPSMIPYSQSSQKNGGKAKARNAAALANWYKVRVKFGLNCVKYACLPGDYRNRRGPIWDKINKRRIENARPYGPNMPYGTNDGWNGYLNMGHRDFKRRMNEIQMNQKFGKPIPSSNSKFHVPSPNDPPEVQKWHTYNHNIYNNNNNNNLLRQQFGS